MERHRFNIHSDLTKTTDKEDLMTGKENEIVLEYLEEEDVSGLDIVTDYYNRLITDLAQHWK